VEFLIQTEVCHVVGAGVFIDLVAHFLVSSFRCIFRAPFLFMTNQKLQAYI